MSRRSSGGNGTVGGTIKTRTEEWSLDVTWSPAAGLSRLNAILNRETLIRCLLREYTKKRANFFKVGKTRL